MRTIKTRPGLPYYHVWPLSLFIPAVILWIPYNSITPFNQIIIAISSLTLIFTTLTLFPRKRILIAFNDCQIQTAIKSIRNINIDALVLTNFGRVSGTSCNFYEKTLHKPCFGFKQDSIEGLEKNMEPLIKVLPSLFVVRKTTLFGGLSDWVSAFLTGVAIAGLLRAIFALA